MNEQLQSLSKRLKSMEDELRVAKRAENKLQGLLYCLRNDITAHEKSTFDFDKVLAERSRQYDVDMLTEKCKVRDPL
jgi:hypothetical protein